MKQQHSHHNIWGSKFHLLPMLCAVLLLLAGSCTDHNGLDYEEKKITFSLDLSKGFAPSTYSLTDHDEKLVSTIDVLVFDGSNKYFSGPHYGLISGNQVTVGLPDNVGTDYTIAVFGNSRGEVNAVIGNIDNTTTKADALKKIVYSHTGKWNSTAGSDGYKSIPMYGELKKSELSSKSVSMIRALARVNVSLTGSALSKFTMNTVHLANYNTKGHVANIAQDGQVEVPDEAQVAGIDDALLYDNVSNNAIIKQDIYTFEAKAGSPDAITTNPCIIIGGTYKGAFEDVECYYRIDFVDYQTGNYLPIQRNYSYDVVINSISNPGFGDIEEAFASPGSNISPNLHYTITPWTVNTEVATNCNGMNTITTSAFQLEFDSAARGSGNGDNILFVQTDHGDGWAVEIEYKNGSGWLSLLSMDGTPITTCADLSSSHYPFQLSTPSPIKLEMSANNGGSPRTAIIKFKAGNVTYPVEVKQSNVAHYDPVYRSEGAAAYSVVNGGNKMYIPVSRANAGTEILLSDLDVFTVGWEPKVAGNNSIIKDVKPAGNGSNGYVCLETGIGSGEAEVFIKKDGTELCRWTVYVSEQMSNSYIIFPDNTNSILIPVSQAYRACTPIPSGVSGNVGEASLVESKWFGDGSFLSELVWQDNGSINLTHEVIGTGRDACLRVALAQGDISKQGNAVIGIRKKKSGSTDEMEGGFLWSWHLWVVDYDPDTESTSSSGFMSRNLGALRSDYDASDASSKGLYYQWGRKDPFPAHIPTSWTGSTEPTLDVTNLNYRNSSNSTLKKVSVTGTDLTTADPSSATKTTYLPPSGGTASQNLGYAISNPHIFYTNGSDPYDWYTTTSANRNNNLWGGYTSHNSLDQKTVYDPCPDGWRVPSSTQLGTDATGSDFLWYVNASTNYSPWTSATKDNGGTFLRGYTWDGSSGRPDLGGFFPASGSRNFDNGDLNAVGTLGLYWSSSPSSTSNASAGYLNFSGSNVYPASNQNRATAFSLRCIQEF